MGQRLSQVTYEGLYQTKKQEQRQRLESPCIYEDYIGRCFKYEHFSPKLVENL